MKVLHVISGLDPKAGGPSAALVGLLNAQAASGLQARLIATWRSEEPTGQADRLRRSGVDVKLIGPCSGPLMRHPDLSAAIEQGVADADVVHIHALWEEIQHIAAQAARKRNVPYVIRPCGMLSKWSLGQSRLKKKIYILWRLRKNLDNAAVLHFTSPDEVEGAKPLNLRPRAIVEPNGVDLSEFTTLPPKGTFRGRYPQIGQRPLVAFLGRVHPGKGVEHLIPAMAKAEVPNAMLAVIGPDSDGHLARMKQLATDQGIADRVIFTGMLTGADRVAALADADLFSLPSDHENFGVSIIESLAAGVPVIVSDQVGIRQVISAGGVGAVVPIDIPKLGKEIKRWLGDADLRSRAAARARPFVWEHYDWLKIAQRWKEHYTRLLAERGQRAPD